MSKFPPSISIISPIEELHMESIEKAIDQAFLWTNFDNFKLDITGASQSEDGMMISYYDVIRIPKLDVKKLVYSKYL